jgi:FkbM family methyltransferase
VLASILKSIYAALPLKRPVFNVVRKVVKLPFRVYQHLWFRGTFSVETGRGSRFQMVSHGHQLETMVFWGGLVGSWEHATMDLWTKACVGAHCVLDVGANTGLFALAAKAISPTARVHCFEPIPRVRERLDMNVGLNGMDIHVHGVAASDRKGTAQLHHDISDHGYLASLEHEPTSYEAGSFAVPTERIDDILRTEGVASVDLVKIDVERHEPAVLRGMGRYLDDRPTLFVEVLSASVAQAVEAAVQGRGYLYFRIDEAHGIEQLPHIIYELRPGHGFNYLICTAAEAKRLGVAVNAA